MSDRVAIIGGSEIGRDHFPFSVFDLSQLTDEDYSYGMFGDTIALGDGGSIYPLGVSLATISRWYWLVKSWDVNVSASFTADANDGFQSTYSVSYFGTINVPSFLGFGAPNRESDLVRNFLFRDPPYSGLSTRFGAQVGFNKTIQNLSASTTAPDGLAQFDLNVFAMFLQDPPNSWVPAVMFGSNLLYPNLGISMELRVAWDYTYPPPPDGDGSTQSFGISSLAFSRFQIGGDPTLPGGTCSLDGINWQLYGEDNNDNLKSQSWNVSITPHEFWAYAAKDSSPIYNTSDGSQLQSPFN